MVSLSCEGVKLLYRKNTVTLLHAFLSVGRAFLITIQHEIDGVSIKVGGVTTYVESSTLESFDTGNSDMTAGGGGTIILRDTKLRHG